MITVSNDASSEIQRLIDTEHQTEPFIRVSVKGGGCSGLMYDLQFDGTNKNTGNVNFFV